MSPTRSCRPWIAPWRAALVTQDLSGRRKRPAVPTDAIGQAVVETVTDLLQMQMAYHAV